MNSSLKFRLICVVASLLCSSFVWANTEVFSKVAEDFFIDVRAGDKEAFESAISPQWKGSIEPAVFDRFLTVLRLNDYKSVKWESSEITDGIGRLKGEFSSSDQRFPITVNFLQHGGRWLIHGISVLPSTPHADLAAPDFDASVELVTDTMQRFANAVNARSMKSFYEAGSEPFRIRHSVEDLDKAFSQFYGEGDFRERVAGVPGLAKPTVKDGYLIVEGGYQTGGYKSRFKLDYAVEGAVWKIIGFGLSSNLDEEAAEK